MKKYACSRLYATDGQILPPSVVVVGGDGTVKGHHLLTEEISATEWLGGVIVLSDKDTLPPKSGFRTFLHRLISSGQPVYAWHISAFDFLKDEFTPQSIIRRL